MRFDEGPEVPYKLTIERTPGERLVAHLMLDGRQGAEADIMFTPQDDGDATLMTARVRADRAVLREALAGTSKARLGYAPDWMFNLTLKPLLGPDREQIEQVGGSALGFRGSRCANAPGHANSWRSGGTVTRPGRRSTGSRGAKSSTATELATHCQAQDRRPARRAALPHATEASIEVAPDRRTAVRHRRLSCIVPHATDWRRLTLASAR